ncbi:hypothetical protein DL96DRAFT_1710756 [Flagelloscypha sp. PMI_526]|nr:hypothetical protein DL96DRAFT_1710756 [Flagelloscypha sp. PMI_526]
MAPPRTENVDERVVAGVEATTATDIEEEPLVVEASSLKWDIEEGERRCPPSPPPTLPPHPPLHDPGPELELLIEPVDNIEAELAERKRRRNEILAKNSSHQRTPPPQTPSVPTESPSTKASTPVGDGDGDATAAEDFGLKPNLRNLDAERALLHRTQDVMEGDEDEFEEVEEVVDDEDVNDIFASDDDEKPKKKVVKKVKKSRPATMLLDGGVGLDAADGPEGY